jgi:hypothetical protein
MTVSPQLPPTGDAAGGATGGASGEVAGEAVGGVTGDAEDSPRSTVRAPDGDSISRDAVSEEARSAAAAALREAFTRLQPQGSTEWNFLAAFMQLLNRYGPYEPGASGTSDLAARAKAGAGRRGGRLDRIRSAVGRAQAPDEGEAELEEAMAHVVEAFRFLSARVETLEARLEAQDRPIDAAAWLVPAQELGAWVEPIAAHVLDRTSGGDVVHADCGEGSLVTAIAAAGAPAQGVEPRGGVALHALERGCRVVICEADEHLGSRAAGSLGGLVLSGVVDRLPVAALVRLLAQSRRALAPGAPLVVVTEHAGAEETWEPEASDLLAGRPLHGATWGLLLERAGFTAVNRLDQPIGGRADPRLAFAAAAPA